MLKTNTNKKGSRGHEGLFGTSLFAKPDTRSNWQKFTDGLGDAGKAFASGTKNVAKSAGNVAADATKGAAAGLLFGAGAAAAIAAAEPQTVEVERNTTYGPYGGRTTTTTTTSTTGYGSKRTTTSSTSYSYDRAVVTRVEAQFDKLYNRYDLNTVRVEIWEGKSGARVLIQNAIRDWNNLLTSEIWKLEDKFGTLAIEQYKNYLRREKKANSATRTGNYI